MAPTNIEFVLRTDENDNKYIIANFDDTYNKDKVKLIINMFLEIFGFCELFDKSIIYLKQVIRLNVVIGKFYRKE